VLRGSARGLMKGKRSQVWEATIVDEQGAVAATGRVRLICLEAGADLAGKVAGVAT
jgi:acyl-coenzyme A thioesterase PaaI-like protein